MSILDSFTNKQTQAIASIVGLVAGGLTILGHFGVFTTGLSLESVGIGEPSINITFGIFIFLISLMLFLNLKRGRK